MDERATSPAGGSMSREEILALLERRRAAIRSRDAQALANLYAEDGEVISPFAGGPVTGREAVAKVHEAWFKAFPDAVFTDDPPLIDGERVSQISTGRGTDTGGILGHAPSKKPFVLHVVHFYTMSNGFIAREQRVYDFTGLLVQIGILKAKPA
jgi:predicted ester cyclase